MAQRVATATITLIVYLLSFSGVLAGDWKRGKYGKRPAHLGNVNDYPWLNHQPVQTLAADEVPDLATPRALELAALDAIQRSTQYLVFFNKWFQKRPVQCADEFTWCGTAPGQENHCAPSWNQHTPQYCGSCFLHGTLSMIQDRLKIMKAGGSDIILSRQTFLNCAPYFNMSAGCNGGDVIDVLHYMDKYGLPDDTCMPYSASDFTKFKDAEDEDGNPLTECPPTGHCSNCMPIATPAPEQTVEVCWAVSSPIMYKLASYGKVGCGEAAMQSEILQRGPITCSIGTDDSFVYSYRHGVYQGPNSTDIDHDVEVVGWGVDEADGPYWHVRNSWGSYWGEMGFIKVPRGNNFLSLEACDCWYAIPTWDMEQGVASGDLDGTMYGVIDSKDKKVMQNDDEPTLKDKRAIAQRARAQLIQQMLGNGDV